MRWCRNCYKLVKTTFLYDRCKVCNGTTLNISEAPTAGESIQISKDTKFALPKRFECPYCDSPFLQFMKSTLQLEHHILVCHGINVTSGSISYPNDRMRVNEQVERINKLIKDTNKKINSTPSKGEIILCSKCGTKHFNDMNCPDMDIGGNVQFPRV